MKKMSVLVALFAVCVFASANVAAHDYGNGSRMAAMHAKHQARLHDKLKLSAAQEAAWKTFTEKTKHDFARRRAAHEELATLPTPARMDGMLALMKEAEGRMAEHAAAVKEFYAQLEPQQQKIFDDHAKAWFARSHGMRHAHHGKPAAAAAPAK